MLTVLIRTLIIYLSLVLAMRLMGKRQIGELEVSDLVTTFLISEIASLPITDTKIPLSHALIPIIVLLRLEVAISFILAKFPKVKFLFSARPSTLIRDGKLCKKALDESRLSFDELFSQLRQQGFDDISKINYAILEQNGNITVIEKEKHKPPSAEALGLSVEDGGLFHIIIEKGSLNAHGLSEIGYSKEDIFRILEEKGYSYKDIYLMLVNDSHATHIIPFDKSKKDFFKKSKKAVYKKKK